MTDLAGITADIISDQLREQLAGAEIPHVGILDTGPARQAPGRYVVDVFQLAIDARRRDDGEHVLRITVEEVPATIRVPLAAVRRAADLLRDAAEVVDDDSPVVGKPGMGFLDTASMIEKALLAQTPV